MFRFGRLTIGIKAIWALSIISAAHAFDYVVHRVKLGLTSCEEFATPPKLILNLENSLLQVLAGHQALDY